MNFTIIVEPNRESTRVENDWKWTVRTTPAGAATVGWASTPADARAAAEAHADAEAAREAATVRYDYTPRS